MPGIDQHLRPRRRSTALTWLVIGALVAGCAGAATSPSAILTNEPPTPAPTLGSSPSPASTTGAATPSTSPTGPATADPLPGVELVRSSVPRAAADTNDATGASRSINAFGLNLYAALLADPGADLRGSNVVFSPTSIAFALSMARAGARSDTARQIDAVLHSAGWDELATGVNALDQALAAENATWKDDEGKAHALALRIANAAFGQRAYPFEQDYLDSIAAAFGAGVQTVDYRTDPELARASINGWVSDHTEKRIRELLRQGDVQASARLFLVNAVYLKANWAREFETEETVQLPFTLLDGARVDVPTMTLQGQQDIPLAAGAGWQATELRYVGADRSTPLAMTLVLPDDLRAFEDGLTAEDVDAVVARLDEERARQSTVVEGEPESCGTYPYAVRVFLPRFGIETRANLESVLARLGMPLALDPATADFSGIADPSKTGEAGLYIAKVIHQANIDVDEKGTEAAAATAIGMDTGGCTAPEPAKVETIRLDRPFLFAIRDVETGAILFMGRVLDPSAAR